MPVYLRLALVFFAELLVYDLVGALLPVSWSVEKRSTAEQLCAGFLITTGLLEVLGFAATLMEMPLLLFSVIWAGVLSVLCGFSLVFRAKRFFAGVSYGIRNVGLHPAVTTAGFFLILFLILILILPVSPDTEGVIAQMTQDLEHNALSLYAGGTGERAVALLPEQLIGRYALFDLFVCRLAGVHPMIEMRVVRPLVTAVICAMAVYRIFMRLLDEKRTYAGAGLVTFFVLAAFFQRMAAPSGMLLLGGWSGNASFTCCVLPAVLLLLLALYEEPDNIRLHILLFFAGLSAISFSAQAVFIFPIFLAAGIIPIAMHARDLLYLFRMILWIVVPATALVLYLVLPLIPMG